MANGRKVSENDSDFNEENAEDSDLGEEESELDGDEDDSGEDDSDESDEGVDDEEDSEISFEVESNEKIVEKSDKNSKEKEQKKFPDQIVKTNGIDTQADKKEVGKTVRIKTTAIDAFKNELNGKDDSKKDEIDEYAHDTDDEEDIRNTVGNIPMHWYDEYKHIGYDWDAKKIIKPAKRDQLDDFLKRMEDPDFWRTVKDPQTGQDVVLSDADIELIKRINSRRNPDGDFDDYTVSFFPLLLLR